ncbi:MAG TPA: hypothetical protein VJT31_12295 [Rugosimonospora sp.]|nr:hypothetical protein [Rugosimonospora sp.]
MSIAPLSGIPQSALAYAGQGWTGRRARDESASAGLDPAELDRQVRDGATIADVAAAKGISPAKVIEAISSLMVPNPDLNGDVAQRLSLRRTVPVRRRVAHRTMAIMTHPVPAQPDQTTKLPGATPHVATAGALSVALHAASTVPPGQSTIRGPQAVARWLETAAAPTEDDQGGTAGSLNIYA